VIFDGWFTAPGVSLVSATWTVVDGPAARLTRPMPPSPPLTVAGCNVTELSEIGGAALIVNGALSVVRSSAAVTVNVCVVGSPCVYMRKVCVVTPGAIHSPLAMTPPRSDRSGGSSRRDRPPASGCSAAAR